MRFCGIDLHSNNSVVVVTDETDKVLVSRRCPNDLQKILALLAPYRDELTGIVVESTYNWYWLVDGLMAAGYNVKLANTVAMKRYDGLKHSDDETDAAHLAHLLRLGILPTGHIHPPTERALRDLARKRIQLVRDRTRMCWRCRTSSPGRPAVCVSSNAIKRWTAQDVVALGLEADICLAMQTNVAVIAALNLEIERIEARLLEGAKLRPDYARLKSIPGIGEVLAIVIMLETGDVSRFAQVGNFASYARCVDSARYSNGKKKGERQHQERQCLFGVAFIEAANFARRFNEEARRFFDRKKARANGVVATQGAGAQTGAGELPRC